MDSVITEQKLQVFISKLIRVIKEKYDLDTQIKISDVIYKFYYMYVGEEVESEKNEEEFNLFVAIKFLNDKFKYFLSSGKNFISIDYAYDIVKSINGIIKNKKNSEIAFSNTRIPENVLFFIENSNLNSHYFSVTHNELEHHDLNELEKLNSYNLEYIKNISQENRKFLNSLSEFALNKLMLSVGKILLPRVRDLNLDKEASSKILNLCIDELRTASDLNTIEEMFRKRSSDTKYIWLWAKIRMRWVNNFRKLKKSTEQKNNSVRRTKR